MRASIAVLMRIGTGFFAAAALAGCGSLLDPEHSIIWGDRANLAAATQIVDTNFEKIDLIAALVPDAKDREAIRKISPVAPPTPNATGSSYPNGPAEERIASTQLSAAYIKFYERMASESTINRQHERNRIQDEVFRVSEQNCNIFKLVLRRTQAAERFAFGSITTLLGGLGAIFTPANTARALAGAAGIVSGVGAEYEQAYFSNLAVEVIVAGIDSKRKSIYEAAVGQRQNVALEGYTIEHAILDGVRYHGACSIVEGLKEAGDAIQTVRNPGLSQMVSVINNVGAAKRALDRAQSGQPSDDDEAAAAGRQTQFPSLTSASLIDTPAATLDVRRTDAANAVKVLIADLNEMRDLIKNKPDEVKQRIAVAKNLSKPTDQDSAFQTAKTQVESAWQEATDALPKRIAEKFNELTEVARTNDYTKQLEDTNLEIAKAQTAEERKRAQEKLLAIQHTIAANLGVKLDQTARIIRMGVKDARSKLQLYQMDDVATVVAKISFP